MRQCHRHAKPCDLDIDRLHPEPDGAEAGRQRHGHKRECTRAETVHDIAPDDAEDHHAERCTNHGQGQLCIGNPEIAAQIQEGVLSDKTEPKCPPAHAERQPSEIRPFERRQYGFANARSATIDRRRFGHPKVDENVQCSENGREQEHDLEPGKCVCAGIDIEQVTGTPDREQMCGGRNALTQAPETPAPAFGYNIRHPAPPGGRRHVNQQRTERREADNPYDHAIRAVIEPKRQQGGQEPGHALNDADRGPEPFSRPQTFRDQRRRDLHNHGHLLHRDRQPDLNTAGAEGIQEHRQRNSHGHRDPHHAKTPGNNVDAQSETDLAIGQWALLRFIVHREIDFLRDRTRGSCAHPPYMSIHPICK